MNLHRPDTLQKYLLFVYLLMIANTPLFAAAMEKSLLLNGAFEGGSPDNNLYAFYRGRWAEKKGHDDWLLAELGLSKEEAMSNIDWAAARIVGAQYYLIEHLHPALLLGYLQAMEMHALPDSFRELEDIHGEHLLRTILIDMQMDRENIQETAFMISQSSPILQAKIKENRIETTALLYSVHMRYANG